MIIKGNVLIVPFRKRPEKSRLKENGTMEKNQKKQAKQAGWFMEMLVLTAAV